MSTSNNARLLSLASAYCDGTLSADEFARLEHLLLDDADARVDFRRYLGLDAALRDHGESAALYWKAPARPQQWTASRRLIGAVALAMVGLAVSLTVTFYRWPASSMVIGTLQQVTGEVRLHSSNGEVRAIASETKISQGDTVRTRGGESSTVVKYADGTRLTLVGDTSVTFGAGEFKNVVVHEGTLAASVQPQPRERPMLLATPSAQVQVLGTRFQVEAVTNRTDLSVTEGRVRLVRTRDGKTLDVSIGKHAVVTEQSKLLLQDIPSLPAAWEVDFEHGLPDSWDVGERIAVVTSPKKNVQDLAKESPFAPRGAVKAVLVDNEDLGAMYKISSNEAWLHGLFAIHKTSHLHVTFKVDKPEWVNVLLATRTSDPHEPRFSGNYLFKDVPQVAPGQWQTLTIPLPRFQRIHRGDVPLEEVVPYKLTFFSDAIDRGLVIDRIWVTPDGPGDIVLQEVE